MRDCSRLLLAQNDNAVSGLFMRKSQQYLKRLVNSRDQIIFDYCSHLVSWFLIVDLATEGHEV